MTYRNTPSRRERWKGRVLKTPTLSHGTRLFLVHTLAKHMKADGFVSRPRWKLADDAGVSERQVTRYMSNAVSAGWLAVAQAGYRTMTAEYYAQFPDRQSGTQDVSLSEPEKGDANWPPFEVTNASLIPAGKRDVGRPTTSSSTTRRFPVSGGTNRTRAADPASHVPSRRCVVRLGLGMNESDDTARTPCRTQARTVERHRPDATVTAPVATKASGTDPANRIVCLKGDTNGKAQPTMSETQPLEETLGSPEAECGEVFYGWAPRGQWRLDFTVPRRCDKPAAHDAGHDWQAGHDRYEYEPPTPEKRARMRRRAKARREAEMRAVALAAARAAVGGES